MSIRKTNTELLNTVTNAVLYSTTLLLGVICIAGLGSILFTAYFGVPVGDDYLAIKTFSNGHTWLHEAWHSFTHTGRYMQSIAASIAYGVFGNKIAILLPLITIGWLYILLYLYGRLVANILKTSLSVTQGHFISAASIVVIVTAGRVIDPQGTWLLYQPFFFSSAIVTYTLCALSYATLFYVYIRFANRLKQRPIVSLTIFTVIAYLIGLFNETAPATMMTLAVILAAVSYVSIIKSTGLRTTRPYLLSLATASVLSLATMYLSPSGAARRHATGAMQDDNEGIIEPILSNVFHTVSTLVYRPSDMILIAVIASLIYLHIFRHQNRKLPYQWTAIVGVGVLLASLVSLTISITFLVLGYGAHTGIYPRTFLIFQLTSYAGALLTFLGGIGFVMQKLPRNYQKTAAFLGAALTLVALVAIMPHATAKLSGNLLGTVTYHQVWTHQDKELREDAATHPNETVYLDDAGAGIGDAYSVQCKSPYSSSTIWLTNGMEAYYGLREICSKTDLGKP